MSDYNRRVAEALGWMNVVPSDSTGRLIGNRPSDKCICELPRFKTDWTQLPAILAGIFAIAGSLPTSLGQHESLTIDIWKDETTVTNDGNLAYGCDSNLLLAAGALLLKLTDRLLVGGDPDTESAVALRKRIDELTKQLAASEAARFASENLAADMAGLVREARALLTDSIEVARVAGALRHKADVTDWLARTALKDARL